ncbi:MAG: deoxyhypusine synthase [Candidatus Woesearchaeota archaeon]
MPKHTLEEARKYTMHESEEPKGLQSIHGYEFDKGVDYDKMIDSFATTGYQATELSKAINIINEMRKEKNITIYLAYTSNMVSSGLRDIFCFLAKNKMVDVIVTTAGGIEEDIIKCLGNFLLGDFYLSGKELREKGINRIGNILVPNERYCKFEDWLNPILEQLYTEQKQSGNIITTSEFIARLGKEINDESSIYYWCYKNNIPVFCPAIQDGSIGDMLYFFTYKHNDFKIDIIKDQRKFNDITLDSKKTGVIILGAGVVKHFILNSNMLRNGCDYAVYINTAQEYDGSDSGARPDEAVSWGKIIAGTKMIKVYGDATILFPLVVARTFAKKK